jgi:serine protease Do
MSKGVAIVAVNSTGIAANYGFQPGDIVRNINGTNINRVGELVHALNGTSHWDMVVERDGRKLTLSVDG